MLKLTNKVFLTFEAPLFAQARNERDGERLPIEVAVEVEEMRLNADIRSITYCGTCADI